MIALLTQRIGKVVFTEAQDATIFGVIMVGTLRTTTQYERNAVEEQPERTFCLSS